MKLLILDRDGTLNRSRDDYVASADEWEALPGALEAVARLNQAGYRVVVATNQSGIGRGLFETDTLLAIHDKMNKALALLGGRIDAIFFCPHTHDDQCDCRKPRPGMLKEIAARFNADLSGVPAIGDSLRDLQAAAAAGAQPILVLTGKGRKTVDDPALPPDTLVFPDLAAAAAHIAK